MAKQEAECSNRLSVFWLKKTGHLPQKGGWCPCGGIKWTYGGGTESSISFTVNANDPGNNHIRLQYTHTDSWTGEKSEMDYKILLTTTLCHYGGVRYWFVCPLTKNGQYCGGRVGVIYSIGKWFGCRHCGEIAYNSQMQGGRNKGFVSVPDIERAEKDVKRYYYNGKLTRKYRRVIRLNEKFERDFIAMAAHLDKRFGRFVQSKK